MINRICFAIAKRVAQRRLSSWLASPMEYGVKPKRIKMHSFHEVQIDGDDDSEFVFLFDYEMPDGDVGRGYSGTPAGDFAFSDAKTQEIADEDLVYAYMGMRIMLLAGVEPASDSSDDELIDLARDAGGLSDIEVLESLVFESRPIIEFRARQHAKNVRGASGLGTTLVFSDVDELSRIPVYYSLVGRSKVKLIPQD